VHGVAKKDVFVEVEGTNAQSHPHSVIYDQINHNHTLSPFFCIKYLDMAEG